MIPDAIVIYQCLAQPLSEKLPPIAGQGKDSQTLCREKGTLENSVLNRMFPSNPSRQGSRDLAEEEDECPVLIYYVFRGLLSV